MKQKHRGCSSIRCIFVVALAACALPLWAQGLPRVDPVRVGMSDERLARIAPVMRAYVDQKFLAGSLVLIARRGKVVYLEGFGAMDREQGRAMSDDTINGGSGNDTIFAGIGNDLVSGGPGDDVIFDGAGDDTISGDEDDDQFWLASGSNDGALSMLPVRR